jgi:pimeloyl-ACP methyl ester carboxylesterase
VAESWHALMTEILGYRRFGAFGGNIGGGVTQWLGALYPNDVVGIHVTSAVITEDFADAPPTPAERAYLDALAAYDQQDQGYSEIMWTRPDTVAAALIDSPAGLVAWIIDKYRDWSDCGGDLERAGTRTPCSRSRPCTGRPAPSDRPFGSTTTIR